MVSITIYSTQTCPVCKTAKAYFKSKNLKYTEIDVTTDIEKQKEMMEKSGGTSVPVIILDDEVFIGFEQKKIEKILKDKGAI